MQEENIGVNMVRPDLDHLPRYDAPSPYSIRPYRSGDAQVWQRIHLEADVYNTFPDSRYAEQFGTDESLLRENQFYLCDAAGCPVGTATAWHCRLEGRARDDGLVHWVAILPAHQGKGLSKPLLGAVCHRLRERGFRRITVTTGQHSFFAPARQMYEACGFVEFERGFAEKEPAFGIVRYAVELADAKP